MSESPGNNGSPVVISAKTHPQAHISTGFEYSGYPTKSSGDRYHLNVKDSRYTWLLHIRYTVFHCKDSLQIQSRIVLSSQNWISEYS